MNKSEFLKAIESEYKAAANKVDEIEAALAKSKEDLEYWRRQKDALHTVNIRLMFEHEKEKKQAAQGAE